MFYSMFLYYYRLNGLMKHKIQVYYDFYGPILMTIGMLVSVIFDAIFRT